MVIIAANTSNIQIDLICKEIKKAGDGEDLEEDYNNERHVLSSLRCLNHPSIIKLVTAYRRGDSYNFLFPVADGDLKYFLSLEQRPLSLHSDQAIFDALWSLSSALESMHSYFAKDFNVRQIGCHYDIKPGNILYLEDRFLLSDFGLSRLRPNTESSRSLYKGVEGSYIAPECEPASEDFERARIGRSSDMWSFGCFLFEMLAYLQDGPQAVTSLFNARRKKLGPHWAYYFHAGDSLDASVSKFLQSTDDLGSEKGQLRSLAVIISLCLQIEPEARIDSSRMTLGIFHIAQQTMYRSICSLYDELSSLEGDFELYMEHLRLRIWADAVGLTQEWRGMSNEAWLASPRSHEELEKIQRGLSNIFKEMKFIQHHSDIEDLVTYHKYYHLQSSLDDLWDMQPASIRASMMSRLESTALTGDEEVLPRDMSSLFDDREVHGQALEAGFETARPVRSDYRRIALLAIMRRIASAIAHQKPREQNLIIDKNLINRPPTPYHSHLLSRVDGIDGKVLIERMFYQEAWYSRTDALLQRIKAITSLRNNAIIRENLPVLESGGYYHEPSQRYFGIIYRLPHTAKDTDPKSLHDVIQETSDRQLQPSLTMKFVLANKLVNHVSLLHKAGWLHKNICSFNLMCFPGLFPNKAASIVRPWIIGFNYSRVDDKTAFTEGPGFENDLREYQHPEYLRSLSNDSGAHQGLPIRFRPEFDYYSIGLVLLEVAYWKPLKRMTKKIHGPPTEMMRCLLEDYVPWVRTYMGDLYAEAVVACLKSYSGADVHSEEAQKAFESRVIAPIQGCRV